MSGLAAGWPGLMAGYLVKTTVVLTLALLAAAAARKRPAALRHFILSSALAGLLLLPLLELAPVGWRSPLLPSWMAPSATGPGRNGPMLREDTSTTRTSSVLDRGWASPLKAKLGGPGGVAAAEPDQDGGLKAPRSPRQAVEGAWAAPSVGADPAVRPSGLRSRRDGVPASPLSVPVLALWLAGAAALLLRLFKGLAGAARLTSEGKPLEGSAWRLLLDRFLALVSMRRRVDLKTHPEVLVPLTWGWRKPVVLLPDGAEAWTDDERSSALYHELSHIKRADFLVMLLVRTSLAVFWWNPLGWVVYRELLKEQEIACDELVLRAGIRPSTYAAALLAFRRSAGFRWNPSAALLGMLGRSSFQDRVAAILKQKLTFMEVKMKTKITLALALVGAVALVGTARPATGGEAKAARTVLAETALPAAGPALPGLEARPAAQATAATAVVAQEKEKEQEKAKAAEKAKTIVIKPVEVQGRPIEVVIVEGKDMRTLKFDKPLTITKSKDGGAIVLKIDGKDVEVLEGEPLRLEIKGGEIEVIRSGRAAELAEGGALKLAKVAGRDGVSVIVETTPEVRVAKVVKEGEPGNVWTVVESGKKGAAAKIVSGKKGTAVWVDEGGQAYAYATGLKNEEMLEKVHALQEQVQAIKAKEMDITALEDSLKKLEAELKAKEEKLKALSEKLEGAARAVRVSEDLESGDAEAKTFTWKMEEKAKAEASKVRIRTADDGKGTINLVFTGQAGEEGRAAFERAVAGLKKQLPEGYKIVEQDYEDETGTMTFKISGPEGAKTDKAVVEKLVELVQREIKRT